MGGPLNHTSSELRAVGVATAEVDKAQEEILKVIRAALDAERAEGVPVSEAFVERILCAVTMDVTGIRRPLLSLAWAEYLEGRNSTIGERPTPIVPPPKR